MLKSVSLRDIIAVGARMIDLAHVSDSTPSKAVYELVEVLQRHFELLGLDHSHLAAESLWRNVLTNSNKVSDRPITPRLLVLIRDTAKTALMPLFYEAGKRQFAELKSGDVSQRLRNLPNDLSLTDRQKHLLDETIRCLECEAYRSAAVMGWNLAYDYIRQWILSNPKRLADFNAQLTKNPKCTPIAVYEDFFEQKEPPGEFRVIECCRDANLINGKVFDKMVHYLRERNQYAHANDSTPTMHTTNAFIENLINLISVAPFR